MGPMDLAIQKHRKRPEENIIEALIMVIFEWQMSFFPFFFFGSF